jgi:hypothetical protein
MPNVLGDRVFLAETLDYAPVETRFDTERVEILQKMYAKGRLARITRTDYDAFKRIFKPEIMTHD